MVAQRRSCYPFILRFNTVVIFILFLNEAVSLLITNPVADGQVDISQTEKPEKPIRMSAMARKAGGNWKPEFIQQVTETPEETALEQENDEEDYSYEDSEEPECPDDMFYHIRGKQCVPRRCPGPKGKSRNQKTGECLLEYYERRGNGYYGRFYGRHYRTVYRPWNRRHRMTRVWTG